MKVGSCVWIEVVWYAVRSGARTLRSSSSSARSARLRAWMCPNSRSATPASASVTSTRDTTPTWWRILVCSSRFVAACRLFSATRRAARAAASSQYARSTLTTISVSWRRNSSSLIVFPIRLLRTAR
jgi:hypothetical protein